MPWGSCRIRVRGSQAEDLIPDRIHGSWGRIPKPLFQLSTSFLVVFRSFLACLYFITLLTSVIMRGPSYFLIPGGSDSSEEAGNDAEEALIEKTATRRGSVNWSPLWISVLQLLFLLISISLAVFAYLRTPSDAECTKVLSPYCKFSLSNKLRG